MPVDPRMISLTRDARGWNQSELASRLDITQGHLSKLEAGLTDATPELLAKLAEVLDCPVGLLEYQIPAARIEVTCLHHRRRATTMSAQTKKRIEAVAVLARISIDGLREGVDVASSHTLHRHVDEPVDPERLAASTRAALGIGPGPVPDVVRAVEGAGVVILHRALGTASQDAVSTWPRHDDAFPMMLVNTGLAPDRLRFTIAHELGHLVMHVVPGEEQELEANRFASAFLAPADEIRDELRGLGPRDMGRLLALKTTWGMSIAALIRRAHDLDELDSVAYKDFQIRLSRLGWRQVEPGDVKLESPTFVQKLISLLRERQGMTDADLARKALISEHVFQRYFLGGSDAASTMKLVI